MRKGRDREKKNGEKMEKKKIMMFIVATNLVASRPLKRRPTGTLHARANFSCAMCTLSYKMSIQTIVSPHFLIFRSSDYSLSLLLHHSFSDRQKGGISICTTIYKILCYTFVWALGFRKVTSLSLLAREIQETDLLERELEESLILICSILNRGDDMVILFSPREGACSTLISGTL